MIDVNRQKFRMLSGAGQFDLSDPAGGAEWSATRRVLRLKSARSLEDPASRSERMSRSANFATAMMNWATRTVRRKMPATSTTFERNGERLRRFVARKKTP